MWFIALAASIPSFLVLMPVGPELRSLLQPGYADVVTRVGMLVESEVAPLALHPRGALFATAFSAHMLLLAAATAVVVTSTRRAGRIGAILVTAAAAVVALHLAQKVGGATSVAWVSGVGEGRLFFGPFVNPNHGGALCAIAAPLALGLVVQNRRYRFVFAVVAIVLVCGTLLSRSRGAVSILGVGMLAFALLDERRATTVAALVGMAIVALGIAFLGPDALFALFSGVVDPSMSPSADLYDERPQLWRDAAGLGQFAPALGVGGDGFLDAYKYVKVSPQFPLASQAHSDPFQIAVEHGFAALLLWILVAVSVVGLGIRACLRAEPSVRALLAGYVGALCGLFAFALFDFPMRIGALLMIGAIVAGTTLGLSLRHHDPAPVWARRLASTTVVLLGVASTGCLALAATASTSVFGDHRASLAAGSEALVSYRESSSPEHLEEARRHFSAAIRQRPMNHMALLQLSRVSHAEGDAALTVRLLALAGEVYPTYPFTWLNIARRHRALGNRPEALDAYRRLIALNHPTEEPRPWLVEAFAYAGDFENLIGYLLEDRADRYCPAAQWLEQSGDRDRGELLYRLGAERSDVCATELGWRMVAWGRATEALAWLEELPPSCLGERTRGVAFLNLRRNAEAVVAFEEAVTRCRASRNARLGLARARLAVGDQRAIPMLENLLEDGDEPAIRHMLFRGYRDLGAADKAADQVIALSKERLATDEELEWLSLFSVGGAK